MSPNGSQVTDIACEENAVRQALERVLQSPRLQHSRNLGRFLRFVVDESLAGRGATLKQHQIAVEALGRDETFDPGADPIVRVQARRLRAVLAQYYENEGAADPIRIELPKGCYAPEFRAHAPGEPEAPASPKPVDVDSAAQGVEGPTIALLAFTPLGSDTELRAFAEGLSEELASAAARFAFIRFVGPIDPRDLVGEGSAREIVGRHYGAHYLVRGAVETCRGRLIATPRLLSCETGETIWSDRFDTTDDGADGQAVERMVTEIATFDGAAIRHWTDEALRRGARLPQKHAPIACYRHWWTTFDRESYASAAKACLEALARWPTDPLANALAADMLLTGRIAGLETEDDALERAEDAARRAVALEPGNQLSRLILGKVFLARGERTPAIAEFEEALSLNPHSVRLRLRIGLLLSLSGDWRRGADVVEAACRLAPDTSVARFALALVRYHEGAFEAAWTEAYRINHPNLYWYWTHLLRAAILGQLGRREAAAAELEQLLRLCPDFCAKGRERMRLMLFSDENVDMLMDGLRKAGLGRDRRSATPCPAVGHRGPADSSLAAV